MIMADSTAPARPQSAKYYGILGISKSASLADIAKAYKPLVLKWHPHRNTSNRAEADARIAGINEAYRVLSSRKRGEADRSNRDDYKSPKNSNHHRQIDTDDNTTTTTTKPSSDNELVISSIKLLSSKSNRATPRTLSDGSNHRRTSSVPTPSKTQGNSRSSSRVNTPTTATSADEPPVSLSRVTSRRTPTPIIFSQTTPRRKPQPIEKKLECTLEELCHGCDKKVKITRDVISNEGMIVQEEEILKIKIKPGWKKGTKITFEGKGDERPGMHPADIIFIIDETRHPVFKRQCDNLELGVEITLVQALTGCTISIPLLGGDQMTISVDEIIFPGYEKRIPGQGMPLSKEGGKRGDLLARFLVEFPTELSEEQRSDILNILDDCS